MALGIKLLFLLNECMHVSFNQSFLSHPMPYFGCLPDLRFRFQLSTRREQKETLPKHTWSAEAFLEEGPISGSLSGSTGAIVRLKDDHKQRLGPQIINSPMLPESIKSKNLNKRAMLLAICLQLRAHRFCRSRKRSLGSELGP